MPIPSSVKPVASASYYIPTTVLAKKYIPSAGFAGNNNSCPRLASLAYWNPADGIGICRTESIGPLAGYCQNEDVRPTF